jgi:hypothetical protein
MTASKPALTLLQPRPTARKATLSDVAAFGQAGKKLWTEITNEFHFEEAAEAALLQQACLAADRLEAISRQIKKDGLTIQGKGGIIRQHPLLKVEHMQRVFISRTLARLGLIEPKKAVGRPPKGGVGIRQVQR